MGLIKYFSIAVVMAVSGFAVANDTTANNGRVGIYVTKHFGSNSNQPLEYGLQLDYRNYNNQSLTVDTSQTRPVFLDLRFSSNGVKDFRAHGVSVLQPAYMLGASEEGFFSSINWGLVGLAVVGGGLLYAAEQDKEDRLDRINDIDRASNNSSGAQGSDGEEGGEEGGGEEPLLGCDPVLGTGQCL